jgi:hypothetical protein
MKPAGRWLAGGIARPTIVAHPATLWLTMRRERSIVDESFATACRNCWSMCHLASALLVANSSSACRAVFDSD